MQGTERATVEFAAYKAIIQESWRQRKAADSSPLMPELISIPWLTSFDNFFQDVGECPPGCQLAKIDSSKRWEKGNAQWA